MAKIPVGGANGLIDQLLPLVGWPASSNPADRQRVRSLYALNLCEKMISQMNGLKYLETRAGLALANNLATVAVPAGMDYGKDFRLYVPSGRGLVDIVPADRFTPSSALSFDTIEITPRKAMLAVDSADSTMKFWFDRPNLSGGTFTYTLVYQQIVPGLTDNGGSTSLLPEGYELTLLMPAAEEFILQRRSQPSIATLSPELQARFAAFYAAYRTNKDDTATDTNLERKKIEVDQMTRTGR